MTLLKVSGIRKKGQGDFVLQNINLTQRRLQKIAIAGETGSGKSTLLQIIAGLIKPDAGKIHFEGESVSAEALVPGHPGVAYLTQDFELPKFLRVEQVLDYANTLSDFEANTLYEVCRIDHLLERKTDQLSGGERQRIAMARLLIAMPRLLLLDEPFSNLDRVHKNILKAVIDDIGVRLKTTCILISHDPEDILSWADQILVMKDGEVIQKGSPEKIYRHPVNGYVAGLFGKYNQISSEEAESFPKSFGFKGARKDLLIRPENFKLEKKGRKTVKGRVSQVSFVGGHYEIEILVAGTSITLKTEKGNLKKGATVHVSFSRF